MAKRRDLPYQAGNREGMQKITMHRTADCVIGGFRYGERPQSAGKRLVGSLLLGLYDAAHGHEPPLRVCEFGARRRQPENWTLRETPFGEVFQLAPPVAQLHAGEIDSGSHQQIECDK